MKSGQLVNECDMQTITQLLSTFFEVGNIQYLVDAVKSQL